MSKEVKDIRSFLMTKGILWEGVDRDEQSSDNVIFYVISADVRLLKKGEFVDVKYI